MHFDRRSWPHNWYGIWDHAVHSAETIPIHAAIDPDWEPEDKGALLSYVANAPIAVACATSNRCLLCPGFVAAGSYQSDGVWLWPAGLAHYLFWHAVVLPDRLAEHIRKRDYTPPEATGVSVGELPWPESWVAYRRLFGTNR